VAYIGYDEMLVQTVTRSQRLLVFAFSLSEVVVTEPVEPTTASEAPTEFPIYIVLGSVGGVVLGALILVLLLAIVCVFGRRRSQEKEKGLVVVRLIILTPQIIKENDSVFNLSFSHEMPQMSEMRQHSNEKLQIFNGL